MTDESKSFEMKELAEKSELRTKPIKVVPAINPRTTVHSKRMKTDDACIVLDRRHKDIKDRLSKTKTAQDVVSIKAELNSVLKELSDLQYRFGKLDKLAGQRIISFRRDASLVKVGNIKSDGIIELSPVTIIKDIATEEGTLILYSDKTFLLIPTANPISTTGPTENELKTQTLEDPY